MGRFIPHACMHDGERKQYTTKKHRPAIYVDYCGLLGGAYYGCVHFNKLRPSGYMHGTRARLYTS